MAKLVLTREHMGTEGLADCGLQGKASNCHHLLQQGEEWLALQEPHELEERVWSISPGTPSTLPPCCPAACMAAQELGAMLLSAPIASCSALRPHELSRPREPAGSSGRGDVSKLPLQVIAVTALRET